jgi:hypothetical protein
MRHIISTFAVPYGLGDWTGNNARAVRACYVILAEAISFLHTLKSSRFAAQDIFCPGAGGININDNGARPTAGASEVWRITNDNAYVNRCAAPGRNPRSRRHREQN